MSDNLSGTGAAALDAVCLAEAGSREALNRIKEIHQDALGIHCWQLLREIQYLELSVRYLEDTRIVFEESGI